MSQDIFIGIDGGGSKSKVRVEDQTGNLIGQALGGPANIRLSVDKAWQSIYAAINEVLHTNNISLEDKNFRFHVGMGLAGCELISAYDDFLHRQHPFATIQLTSDAHVACVGAHNATEGGIIIIGTGIIGYQIYKGRSSRVSGWGFPHDDEGSGAWIGLEAARYTFQWLDHRIEKSPLVEDIYEFFNRDTEQLMEWATKANSTEFAKLAPLVINHSQQGETLAVRLMKKAAHAADKIAVTLHKQSNIAVPVCLFGGIAPFVEPWLSNELREVIVPRKGDANIGAVKMIRDIVNNKE